MDEKSRKRIVELYARRFTMEETLSKWRLAPLPGQSMSQLVQRHATQLRPRNH
jgi:hypothetical protein